ncbi:MAG: LytR/AlgR family response regulator transcription factor [Roseburia sp.]
MRVIYVDNEIPLLDNFRLTAEDIPGIKSLHLFQKGAEALKWTEENSVDVAFLDIDMPIMNGIELAKRLKQLDWDIRIIFVTAFAQYALQAFGVDAIGYLLKPYTKDEVERELAKAALIRPRPKKKIQIQTMPDLLITVEGKVLQLRRTKKEELLAFLIDKGEVGITGGEAVAYLWPEKCGDDSAKALYRVTMHRLMDILKEAGIDYIIGTEGKKKFIRTNEVDCDLYNMLAGDAEARQKYSGMYLREFSWAEERNAQLEKIKNWSPKTN